MKKSHKNTLMYLHVFGPVVMLPGHGTGLRFQTCSELRDAGLVRIGERDRVSLTEAGKEQASALVLERSAKALALEA